jgi:predicted transcriptional regulator
MIGEDNQPRSRIRADRLTGTQMRVLLFLSKSRGWRDSIAQLAREVEMDDGNLHRVLNALIQAEYILDDTNRYKLTKKGRRRIGFLRAPYYILAAFAAVSLFPFYWAWLEVQFKNFIDPLSFVIVGTALVVMTAVLWFVVRWSEKAFL